MKHTPISVLRRFDRTLGNRSQLFELALLLLIMGIAFIIRVLPMRWGVTLSEFDPWIQYKEATYIIERGWSGFAEFFHWHDTESWYPWGRDMGRTAFPGIPFAMAFIYLILAGIGFRSDPLELASILPVVYSLASVVLMYFLGRQLGGSSTGLAAALFIALSNSNISRNHLGWFDDESLSIPLMLLGFTAYLTALSEKRTTVGVIAYSILAGAALGAMSASWGAHKFPLALIPFFAVMAALLGKYSPRLLIATATTFSLYTLIATSVPKLGMTYIFEATIFSGFIGLGILAVFEAASRFVTAERRRIFIATILAGIVIAAVAAITLGVLGVPGLKFISVVLPQLRDVLPIVVSVAENQVPTWSIMFSDLGIFLLMVPFGIYVLLRRGGLASLFIVVYTILSIYFASSMVRLSLVAAPAVAITAGHTFSTVFSQVGRMFSAARMPKRRGAGLPLGYSLITPLIILLLVGYSLLPAAYGGLNMRGGLSISPVDQGYQPVTLLTSSFPTRSIVPDWMRALQWMKTNLPDNAVVMSWWDYGYWITVVGEHKTLVDNGTLNSTQIGEVAYAFMSPPTTALEVLRRHDVTHVVIFVTHQFVQQGGQTFGRLLGFGDEGKWIWMLRIANQVGYKFVESDYLDRNFVPTQRFWDMTLMGQLIPYKPRQTQFGLGHFYEPPQLENYRLVYASSDPYTSLAYVYIYEVVYPEI
ncbi:MAG: STT3 domain-containing protein [Nitrososphaerota archaeon]